MSSNFLDWAREIIPAEKTILRAATAQLRRSLKALDIWNGYVTLLSEGRHSSGVQDLLALKEHALSRRISWGDELERLSNQFEALKDSNDLDVEGMRPLLEEAMHMANLFALHHALIECIVDLHCIAIDSPHRQVPTLKEDDLDKLHPYESIHTPGEWSLRAYPKTS